MAIGKDSVPAQTLLSREYMEKIDHWAESLGHTRSQFLRMLIEDAVNDQKWVLNLLTTRLGLKAVDLIRHLQGEETKTAPQTAVMNHS